MSNPNNCSTCKHKQNNPDGGWCYMFADEPDRTCMKHSMRQDSDKGFNTALVMFLRAYYK